MLPPHIQVRKDISVVGGSESKSGGRLYLAVVAPPVSQSRVPPRHRTKVFAAPDVHVQIVLARVVKPLFANAEETTCNHGSARKIGAKDGGVRLSKQGLL